MGKPHKAKSLKPDTMLHTDSRTSEGEITGTPSATTSDYMVGDTVILTRISTAGQWVGSIIAAGTKPRFRVSYMNLLNAEVVVAKKTKAAIDAKKEILSTVHSALKAALEAIHIANAAGGTEEISVTVLSPGVPPNPPTPSDPVIIPGVPID